MELLLLPSDVYQAEIAARLTATDHMVLGMTCHAWHRRTEPCIQSCYIGALAALHCRNMRRLGHDTVTYSILLAHYDDHYVAVLAHALFNHGNLDEGDAPLLLDALAVLDTHERGLFEYFFMHRGAQWPMGGQSAVERAIDTNNTVLLAYLLDRVALHKPIEMLLHCRIKKEPIASIMYHIVHCHYGDATPVDRIHWVLASICGNLKTRLQWWVDYCMWFWLPAYAPQWTDAAYEGCAQKIPVSAVQLILANTRDVDNDASRYFEEHVQHITDYDAGDSSEEEVEEEVSGAFLTPTALQFVLSQPGWRKNWIAY